MKGDGGLAGIGVGGAVGGIMGAQIGIEITEHEAERYEIRVKEGGILLWVHSDNADCTKHAKEILERTGAEDISATGEAAVNYITSGRPLSSTTKDGAAE